MEPGRGHAARWSSGIVPVLALAAVTLPVSPAGAVGRRKAPDPAKQAAALVAKLSKARSDPARTRALTALATALQIGVYSGAGKRLVKGERRGLYVYDWTLRGVAASFGRGERVGLQDLSNDLARKGLGPSADRGPSVELLRRSLVDDVKRATRKPRAKAATTGLLLRALGLKHRPRYDLAKSPRAEQIQLDAVQVFLLQADLASYLAHRAQGKATASRLDAESAGVVRRIAVPARAAANPCEKLEPILESVGAEWSFAGDVLDKLAKTDPAFAEFATRFGNVLNKVGAEALAKVGAILDGVQGGALAFSVDVTVLGTSAGETHYGHDAAGKPLSFALKVVMLDDYGDAIVKCGRLAGFEIPPKGPISGVDVIWVGKLRKLDLIGDLREHGTLSCGDANPCVTQTGADGVATLVFTPKQEALPGFGPVKTYHSTVDEVPRYQSRFGSRAGTVAEFLFPRGGPIAYEVSYHQANGMKAHFTDSFRGTNYFGTHTYDLRVCGSNPFGTAWSGTEDFNGTNDSNADRPYPLTGQGTIGGTFPADGQTIQLTDSGYDLSFPDGTGGTGHLNQWKMDYGKHATVQWPKGSTAPTMHIDVQYNGGGDESTHSLDSAITADESCPDPSAG
jgi:hypothetical protein